MTLRTAKKFDYVTFYYALLSHASFIFVKLPSSDLKLYQWPEWELFGGACRENSTVHIFNEQHNQQVNAEA